MARKKTWAEVHNQFVRIRDGIYRKYGKYDREFGVYDMPTKGEGKRQIDRASKAYRNTMRIVDGNLQRLGYKNIPLIGGGFDIQTAAKHNVRVDTRKIASKGAVSG